MASAPRSPFGTQSVDLVEFWRKTCLVEAVSSTLGYNQYSLVASDIGVKLKDLVTKSPICKLCLMHLTSDLRKSGVWVMSSCISQISKMTPRWSHESVLTGDGPITLRKRSPNLPRIGILTRLLWNCSEVGSTSMACTTVHELCAVRKLSKWTNWTFLFLFSCLDLNFVSGNVKLRLLLIGEDRKRRVMAALITNVRSWGMYQ